MGRGRQSRQKVADRVRRAESHRKFLEEYGEPKNPRSPSSVFSHVGLGLSFGLTEGMTYGMQRQRDKAIAQQRLEARPLWKIAISDRRIHAAEYDDRRRRDIRNRMRDRAELKTQIIRGGLMLMDEYIWMGDLDEDSSEG